jgi:hypothetical protein
VNDDWMMEILGSRENETGEGKGAGEYDRAEEGEGEVNDG